MLICDSHFSAIDFESAGAERGKTDTPIQIGIACWSVEKGHTDAYTSYLHTTQPILWSAQKVHGITVDHLTNAPTLLSLWPEIKLRLGGAIVVAHGKGTEKKFLRAFPGHGFGPWIDTLLLARTAWPELSSHSLGALCKKFELTENIQQRVPEKSWHDALFDTVASLVLLEHLIDQFDLTKQPLDLLLHPDTSIWHQSRRS
ncbi:3'-5' exonuclease [Luteolibacter pohnpeiensis]|uniref:3'-5' exonuclease n=2 Tax=Luteolibacter pohnpeiensis TaxID=454153 RepID=A0A934S3E1_9BACT|nr:3'-5' exonuclease [Luteolibacter pohnpeiensis]